MTDRGGPARDSPPPDQEQAIAAWLRAADRRARASLTSREFLKALRALSVRYVERRQALAGRAAADTPAKRAAFAAFYGPLHFIVARAIIRAIGAAADAPERLIDLGCGTGVASAAWAVECDRHPSITGVDAHPWAAGEAAWTWRQLGLTGRASRGDAVAVLDQRTAGKTPWIATGIVAGWMINELTADKRDRLLRLLSIAHDRGAAILVIEPIAMSPTPWWPDWTARLGSRGRADLWRFDAALPPTLAALDEAAGFDRDALTAKSLWLPFESRPASRGAFVGAAGLPGRRSAIRR